MAAELKFMPLDTFKQNKDAVMAEVKTILGAKSKTRSRFRFIAVYKTCCGELLAEVFLTSLGHVVVYRAGARGYDGWRRPDDDKTSTLVASLRHGELDVQPLVGNPHQFFLVTCRHPLTDVNGRHIYTFPIWAAHIIVRKSPTSALAFR